MGSSAARQTSDYSYDLPRELIAQDPPEKRGDSRLLTLSRRDGSIGHRRFSQLPSLLRRGDLLVMNDTRVFRARLLGRRNPGGGAAELLCLEPASEPGTWKALVKPGRKLPPGSTLSLRDGTVVEVGERTTDGMRIVRLPGEAEKLFEQCGEIPLPPYITESRAPEERYQTIYSRHDNRRSAAAPTAGLHFTEEILAQLPELGIERTFISLDVGIGTFRPVKVPDLRQHVMHAESCRIPPESADMINRTRRQGGRIVAVGTTAVRTLESFATDEGLVLPGEKRTDIFLYPGCRFRAVDVLLTNFHLPESTLLMLVAAFAGRELVLSAYEEAVRERYRFFSFGDAMLIE